MIVNRLIVLAVILFSTKFSFAQTYVFTEQGLALEKSGGAVLVYELQSNHNLEPMYLLPFSKQKTNAQALSESGKGWGNSVKSIVESETQSDMKNETQRDKPKYLNSINPILIENSNFFQKRNNPPGEMTEHKAGRLDSESTIYQVDQRHADGMYLYNKNYYLSWPENILNIVTAPSKWDREDWLFSSSIAGSLGALMFLDKKIKNFWQTDLRHSEMDSFLSYAEPLGNADFILAGSLGTYMISELLNAKREKGASLLLFQAVALGSAFGEGLKRISGRTRPAGTNSNPTPGSTDFNGFDSGDNDAFPSGHSIVSFATATVVAETYGDDYLWMPWIAYSSASLVAAQRINDNRHWASDVVFGALLGHFIAKLVVKNNVFLSNKNFMVQPMNVQNSKGIGVSFRY